MSLLDMLQQRLGSVAVKPDQRAARHRPRHRPVGHRRRAAHDRRRARPQRARTRHRPAPSQRPGARTTTAACSTTSPAHLGQAQHTDGDGILEPRARREAGDGRRPASARRRASTPPRQACCCRCWPRSSWARSARRSGSSGLDTGGLAGDARRRAAAGGRCGARRDGHAGQVPRPRRRWVGARRHRRDAGAAGPLAGGRAAGGGRRGIYSTGIETGEVGPSLRSGTRTFTVAPDPLRATVASEPRAALVPGPGRAAIIPMKERGHGMSGVPRRRRL